MNNILDNATRELQQNTTTTGQGFMGYGFAEDLESAVDKVVNLLIHGYNMDYYDARNLARTIGEYMEVLAPNNDAVVPIIQQTITQINGGTPGNSQMVKDIISKFSYGLNMVTSCHNVWQYFQISAKTEENERSKEELIEKNKQYLIEYESYMGRIRVLERKLSELTVETNDAVVTPADDFASHAEPIRVPNGLLSGRCYADGSV